MLIPFDSPTNKVVICMLVLTRAKTLRLNGLREPVKWVVCPGME